MNLEVSLLKKYKRITAIKPIQGRLAIAKNDKLYWLYYSGMGQTEYHELPKAEQITVNEMLAKNIFFISDKAHVLPIFDDKGISGEIDFKIVLEHKQLLVLNKLRKLENILNKD